MKRYEVTFATLCHDSIRIVIDCESIYSCIVKASSLLDLINKMGSADYEIAELVLLED